MNRKRSHGAGGFSTLEALITVFLAAVLVTLSTPTFFLALNTKRGIAAEESIDKQVYSAFSQFRISRESSGNNLLVDGVKLTEWKDRAELPLPSATGKSAPAVGSDFLSYVRLDLSDLWEIDRVESKSATELDVSACKIGNGPTPKRIDSKYFAAIAMNGYLIVRGDLLRRSGVHDNCSRSYSGRLALVETLPIQFVPTGATTDRILANTVHLVALADQFTYFIDKQQNLRRYSYLSSSNQPVLRGPKRLSFFKRAVTERITCFDLQVEVEHRGSVSRTLPCVAIQNEPTTFFNPLV